MTAMPIPDTLISASNGGVTVWPCAMPLPNNLHRGDVVYKTEDPTVHMVVITDPGATRDVRLMRPGQAGLSYRDTDNSSGQWTLLPEERRTAVERLHSMILEFEPSLAAQQLLGDDLGNPYLADEEMLPWHMFAALLMPDEAGRLTNEDGDYWPNQIDLAFALAEQIDANTQHSQSTLLTPEM